MAMNDVRAVLALEPPQGEQSGQIRRPGSVADLQVNRGTAVRFEMLHQLIQSVAGPSRGIGEEHFMPTLQ